MKAGPSFDAPRIRSRELSPSIDITQTAVIFGIVATVALRNWSLVVYIAQFLMISAIILHLLWTRLEVRVGLYIGFYGFFAVWCLSSAFWAPVPERAVSGALGVIQFVIVGTAVAAYIIAERRPEFLLDCLAWSVLVLVALLVVLTPPAEWLRVLQQTQDATSGGDRLGSTVGYHANALGRVLAIGSSLWIYKLRANKRHRLLKILVIGALVAVLLLTKSRLSIALFVALLLLFLLFTARNLSKFMMRAALVAVLFGMILWAVLNIPVLYDTVGFRFMAMLGPEGGTDGSTSTRFDMTSVAFQLFAQSPVLGVGFDNFSYYYFYDFYGWAETSAHSNFADLLAGLGLIGVVSYYGVWIWIAINLFRHFRIAEHEDRLLASLLLLLSVSQIVVDFASISYTNEFVQLVIVLLFSCVVLHDNPERSPNRPDTLAAKA